MYIDKHLQKQKVIDNKAGYMSGYIKRDNG